MRGKILDACGCYNDIIFDANAHAPFCDIQTWFNGMYAIFGDHLIRIAQVMQIKTDGMTRTVKIVFRHIAVV